jgi:transposase
MLSISPAVRIFVHALPTDMRKSFDGLYAIVKHAFAKDVFQGDYFVFLNRSRDRCKILYWDRDGLVVWAKRLERGSFQLPGHSDAAALAVEVDSTTLAMILGGVDLHTGQRRKRYQAVRPQDAPGAMPEPASARRSA